MSLCPEAKYRASLSDDEFWDYVLTGVRPDDPRYDEEPEPPDEIEMQMLGATPCPECDEVGACAVDDEGRALIHATTEDDE